MIKFNVLYENKITYPIRASELFKNLCEQVGLEAGDTNFINSDYMILGNPFTNNEDCKTVLSNIAQLAGGFAKIGRDNKVYIVSLKSLSKLLTVKDVHFMPVQELNLIPVNLLSGYDENINEKLDGNNYFEDFAKNNEWGEVNSLVLGISSVDGENSTRKDKESISINGLNEVVIQDNYFLTNQEEREKVIDGIWENIKGIKYLPFKTKYYGYPYLDSGDIICIYDTNDKKYLSYVFNHTFKFNGTYNGEIDTPALTKVQTAYKNIVDVKKSFKKVERSINKINGVITDIIEEQTETSNKLSQHEQTIDGIKDSISNVETKMETVEEDTIVKIDVEYAIGDSATIEPTNNWNTKAPEWENGKYMWQRTVITYGNGKKEISNTTCISGARGLDGKNGTNGENGKDGIGVKKIEEQYYLSDSDKEQIGSSWKSAQDTWVKGKYIWTRNKITWTDDNITYTTAVLATGINNANNVASNANDTANKANQNAQDAVGKVETTVKKVSDMEQTIEGFKRNVSEIEEKVTTVESETEEVSKNLVDNYYTRTQTDTKIEEKAGVITSEVSKTVSTAKQEAVNEANSETDQKLKEYVVEEEFGTKIEQNWEHIKYAWNQISEFIQMMIINNNASFAILDTNKNVLMSLDKTGQHFYKNNGKTVFGEMGVKTVDDCNYITFSISADYNTSIKDGMAWGVTTASDDKFHPILYIKNFQALKDSDASYGELSLAGCILTIESNGGGIRAGNVLVTGDDFGGGLNFYDNNSNKILLSIYPDSEIGSASVSILDKINFFKNRGGGNSLQIGYDNTDNCLLSDDGYILGRYLGLKNISIDGDSGDVTGTFNFMGIPTYQNNKLVYGRNGHTYNLYWTGSQLQFYVDITNVGTLSDKRLKTEIKEIDDNFIQAIKEIEMKQFKVANRGGLISFGILAQDLIEIFERYNINPFDYEIVYKTQYREDDDTIYYAINYEQFLILKEKAQELEIKQLQEKDKQKDRIIQDLIKRIEKLEEVAK